MHYATSTTFGAPAGWKFDSSDWWLEENGLIMEPPQLPVPSRGDVYQYKYASWQERHYSKRLRQLKV